MKDHNNYQFQEHDAIDTSHSESKNLLTRDSQFDLERSESSKTNLENTQTTQKKLLYFILDYLIILPLTCWSEFGFAAFSSETTIASLENPLKRYLYPHLSISKISSVTSCINTTSQVLSYADAGLSILTILDIRQKRGTFIKDMANRFRDLKEGRIKFFAFLFNIIFLSIAYVTNSLAPWVGLKMANYGGLFLKISGPTMFAGQLLALLLLYGNYFFSSAEKFTKIYNIPRKEWPTFLYNLFCSKQGILLFIRSTTNVTTRSMRSYGTEVLNQDYLFGDSFFKKSYPYFSALSSAYGTLTTQSYDDYQKIFSGAINESIENNSSHLPLNTKSNPTNKIISSFLLLSLAMLVGAVFLLRTLSTPSLYTGPIDNPEQDFNTKDLIISIFGLLLGSFASYQYCSFMWSTGKIVVRNIDNNIKTFFISNTNKPNKDKNLAFEKDLHNGNNFKAALLPGGDEF